MMHYLELAPRIAALPRDRRGYPIPFVVMRDAIGDPQFAVNDTGRIILCLQAGLCHVCGQELEDQPWFAGGAANALMNGDQGIYIDGPMHLECAIFSLQVCPHLSHQLPSALNLDPIRRHMAQEGVKLQDKTVIPGVPTLFVLLQARAGAFGIMLSDDEGLRWLVQKPYAALQYWREGERLARAEGRRAARAYVAEMEARLNR